MHNQSRKDKKIKYIRLSENQIYIITGFLYDYDTTASRRAAEYLDSKLDKLK
jgi:hypothetical protein